MEHLHRGAASLIRYSISENTFSTYRTALNAFDKFRSNHQLNIQWPADILHIILFISFTFERGQSPKSIKTYIAGINYWHKLHGWIDLSENFVIKKLLEGFSRARVSKDNRAPITKKLLQEILEQVPSICDNEFESKLFSAIFTLAYFGLFRVSELVAQSKGRLSNQI